MWYRHLKTKEEYILTNRYFLSHSPITFHFAKSSRNFVVEEVPLYEFAGEGEHIVACIRKRDMTTWQMLQELSGRLGVKMSDIGYAGLKDKEAMTIQHISLPRTFEAALDGFTHPNIKILSLKRHTNKIKIGHLKGNKFTIRLKKVGKVEAVKLQNAVALIKEHGMPNYFGHQRFGNDGQNYILGKQIIDGEKKERNRKLKELLINAYQSERFNSWLSTRVSIAHLTKEFDGSALSDSIGALFESGGMKMDPEQVDAIAKESKGQAHFFPILNGDLLCHYPHGKLFAAEDLLEESQRFVSRLISPTGALAGEKVKRAESTAGAIEQHFFPKITMFGDRRYAWIWPEELGGRYIEEEAQFDLGFYLPRGCYATVLLEELAQKSLSKLFQSSSDDSMDE